VNKLPVARDVDETDARRPDVNIGETWIDRQAPPFFLLEGVGVFSGQRLDQ
jgi:hypothetical protein